MFYILDRNPHDDIPRHLLLPPVEKPRRSRLRIAGQVLNIFERNPLHQEVDIPARLGFDRGVWYVIRQGIRGLLVSDERGNSVVNMICEPASHYYRIMTRNGRIPVLIADLI